MYSRWQMADVWSVQRGGTLVNFDDDHFHDDHFQGGGGTLVNFHDDHFHDDHFRGGYPGQLPWWPFPWWPLPGGYPGPLPWPLPEGGPLPWPLPEGDPLLWPLLGGSTSMTTSHHPLELTSLLSRHQLMGLACYSSLYTLLPQCILGRSHGTPPVEQTDRQTWVKTLPSRTLRMRAVMISNVISDTYYALMTNNFIPC